MDSVQINAVKSVVCLAAIAIALLATDRGAFRINLKDVWVLVLAAATNVGMDVLYIQAQTMMDLSLAGVLLSTNCYFAIGISFLFFKDPITVKKVLAAIIGFAGCAFAVGLFTHNAEYTLLGISIGLGAGFGGALHAAFFKLSLEKGYSESTVLLYIFIFSVIMLVPFSDPVGTVGMAFSSAEALIASLAIGLAFTALPYYLYSKGLAGLDIGTVSILMFMETAMAAVAGLLFFDEGMSAHTLIGIAMILASIIILNKGVRDSGKSDGAQRDRGHRMITDDGIGSQDVEDRRCPRRWEGSFGAYVRFHLRQLQGFHEAFRGGSLHHRAHFFGRHNPRQRENRFHVRGLRAQLSHWAPIVREQSGRDRQGRLHRLEDES
jgi:drug/metabolite transporter (DMT)-like permease